MKLSLVVSLDDTSFDAVALRGKWLESIRTVGSLGYDGVELAVRDPIQVDGEALARTIRSAGVEVAALGTGQAYLQDKLSLTSDDPRIRRQAIQRIMDHLRLAASLGAPAIIGLIRGRLTDGRQATDVRLLDSLEQILPLAEQIGVRLLVEPINRYETDYLATIDEVLELIDRVPSPLMGVLADLFHMNIEEASIEGALRRCGSRLGHVHVADSNRQAPGHGHLDFVSILEALAEVGYRGYLSAEILPVPNPEEAAKVTLQYLRPLLASLYSRSKHHSGGKERRP